MRGRLAVKEEPVETGAAGSHLNGTVMVVYRMVRTMKKSKAHLILSREQRVRVAVRRHRLFSQEWNTCFVDG